MAEAQSDLVMWYKLETEFFPDYVRHKKYAERAKNRNERIEENWSDCGELGRGGFGVVHKQIRKATGDYRAVKTINKRLPANFDYSRELLVMAILAKVCGPRDSTQLATPIRYSYVLIVNSFSIHRYLWSS